MIKDNKKIIDAWCMYDWANSAYNLVITSSIFPIYYGAVAVSEDKGDLIKFFDWEINNSVLFSYSVSVAFLIVALISPLLTAMADYSGNKKRFMQFFCYLGAVCCALLFFFTKGRIELGIIAFVIASVGYSGSIVFYNSYLPEIASEEQFDRISARGYSLGYIGSVIQLVLSLVLVLKPAWFGITDGGLPARISFLFTSIWWLVFAQYSFSYLPNNLTPVKRSGNWMLNGFKKLNKVVNELKQQRLLKFYLIAFFFYNMGVQTVMYLAAIFGDKELHLPSENLIITILLLQLVAIPGSYGFARLSARYGNVTSLIVAVVIWIGICIGAYYVSNGTEFYVLAIVVGLVMGGIQALSRATYSKLMPDDTTDTASYFSFYDVVDKVSIVLGTLLYGLAAQLTGSMRASVVVVSLFFIAGLIILFKIPSKKKYTLYKPG